MNWEAPKGMDEYLEPTEFCDCDNQDIVDKATELIKDAKTPKEAALKIFYFVRDKFPYTPTYNFPKASETLQQGKGFCITKTNLQVALLRAAKIPARYHQVGLKKECLKGIIHSDLYNGLDDEIWFHPWCECFLSDKWIACDSVFDKTLVDAYYKEGIITREQIRTIDWDGESDLKTLAAWMINDYGILTTFDDLKKKLIEEVSENVKELAKKMNVDVSQIEAMVNDAFRASKRFTNKLRKKAMQ